MREGGELRPATWDEALGQIVEALSTIGSDACGPSAIGGVTSARVSNEAAYLFQKFFRALVGTNNVDFPDGSAVRAQATGLSNITDIAKSDLIVLVGFDPSEAAPLLDLHIKRAVRRAGAKLLIINPRRIELAKYPGAYLPVLPGNEAVVLNELAAAHPGREGCESASRQTSRLQIASRWERQPKTQYAIRNTPPPSISSPPPSRRSSSTDRTRRG